MSTSYEGRQSAELPVELSDRFELVVNLKTPAGAGLTISASILLRAGEVIETSFHERTLLHMLRSQSGTSRQAPHGRNCISPTFDRTVTGERPASVYRSRPCSNAIRDGFWVADHVSYVGNSDCAQAPCAMPPLSTVGYLGIEVDDGIEIRLLDRETKQHAFAR